MDSYVTKLKCGIQDCHSKERLLREEDRGLEKCIQLRRASEWVKDNLKIIEGSTEGNVHTIFIKVHI